YRLALPGAASAPGQGKGCAALGGGGQQQRAPPVHGPTPRGAGPAARGGRLRPPPRGTERSMTWRRDRDDELDEELRSHLTMAARDRIERGEDPAAGAAGGAPDPRERVN